MNISFVVTAGAILSWALLSVVSRIVLLNFGLDAWSFSFIQLCAGGLVLLVLGGRRSLELSRFARPAIWVLGVLRVLSASLYTAVLVWVSVLEAGTIGSVSVPLVAVAVWMLSGRRPGRGEWFGHLVILCAVAALLAGLEGAVRYAVAGLMGLNALCLVGIAILAERHPDNLSDEPGVRLRFTGSVLLVTAALFLAARFMVGGAAAAAWDWRLLEIGVAVGVLLRAPSMVLSFWSIKLVGAQTYTAAVAFLPLLGMAFEQIAVAAGLIDDSRFQIETLFLALCAVAGTLLVLLARVRVTRRTGAETIEQVDRPVPTRHG